MKREIKFRGQQVDNGEWVIGNLVTSEFIEYTRVVPPDEYTDNDDWIVAPDTVGQYVGVCDDDGREIFEGDVVRCCYEKPVMGLFGGAVVEEEEFVGVIEYRGGSFYIGKHPLENFRPDEMEVIGNIHDNPKMLHTKSE